MKLPGIRLLLGLSLSALTPVPSSAADVNPINIPVPPPNDASELLALARDARASKNHDNADFYLAPYLGLSVIGTPGYAYEKGLKELLKHPSWSRPTSMISGLYQDRFLEYFTDASFAMWALARPYGFHLEGRRLIIREASDKDHYVVVWGQPTFRTWIIMARKKLQKMVVAHSHEIILQFGKVEKSGRPVACGRIDIKGDVVWLYQPKFRAVFPGTRKNLVIRYNQPTADGYIQFLKIYGFNSDENPCVPNLLATFEGRNGLARFKGDFIELSEEVGNSSEGAFTRSFQKLRKLKFDGQKFRKDGIPEVITNFLHQANGWPKYLTKN